ncbi:unnamed protein product [Symbiodinium sp. CCMP2592]|nr:unnamed protein product [Symbiodinium sp. CCMP2592]
MLSWGFSTATDEIRFVAGFMIAGEIPSLIEDAEGACGTDITFQSLASSGKELFVFQILTLDAHQCHQVPICACLVQESDLDDGQEHGMDADHALQTLEAAFAMAATTLSYNNTTVRSIFSLANVSPFQYDLTVVLPQSAAAGSLYSALRPQNAAVADTSEGSPEADELDAEDSRLEVDGDVSDVQSTSEHDDLGDDTDVHTVAMGWDVSQAASPVPALTSLASWFGSFLSDGGSAEVEGPEDPVLISLPLPALYDLLEVQELVMLMQTSFRTKANRISEAVVQHLTQTAFEKLALVAGHDPATIVDKCASKKMREILCPSPFQSPDITSQDGVGAETKKILDSQAWCHRQMAYESGTSFLDQTRVRHLLARLQGQCHDENAQVCEAAYQAVWLCFRCSSCSVKRMLIAGVVADIRERRKVGLRRILYMVSMLETEQLVEVYVLMKYWLHDEMLPDLLPAMQAVLATPRASSLLLSAVADVAKLRALPQYQSAGRELLHDLWLHVCGLCFASQRDSQT